MDRSRAKELIDSFGGKVGSSVTKQTSYLVSDGEISGTKMQKALQLGTKVIFEDEFLAMLEEAQKSAGGVGSSEEETSGGAIPTEPAAASGEVSTAGASISPSSGTGGDSVGLSEDVGELKGSGEPRQLDLFN